MTDDFRNRETLTTILKRHRQVSRLLAESSMSEWRASVDSGYHSDYYQTVASTVAELARLLAPKLMHTDVWTQQLATVNVERMAQDTRSTGFSSDDQRVKDVSIAVSLEWIVNNNGMYTDLTYDGPEPYTAPGMLTNVKDPERVQKPLSPSMLRKAHRAITVAADDLGILDYGIDDQSTQEAV
jgi:hypothetical protein